MKYGIAFLVVACGLTWTTVASAADAVKRVSGATINGTITKMTATDVTIEKTGGAAETVPVTDIEEVIFDKEPTTLRAASATLEKIKTDDITRVELQDDIQFYKVLCQVKLALAGQGDLSAAGNKIFEFVNKHPSSFHYLQANEVLGEAFVANGNLKEARDVFARLEKSPFPDYKARAFIAQGRVMVKEKNFTGALQAFDSVMAMAAQKGQVPDSSRDSALLGKALCLAETGKPDDAIKQIEDVIKSANIDDGKLMGEAYLTLGEAYLKKGAKKEALLAFLHVDVLFFSNGQAHAAALRHLVALWNEFGKPERATQCSQVLQSRYGGGGK
jgi:tetratricopeptide (TPR) repeat protein